MAIDWNQDCNHCCSASAEIRAADAPSVRFRCFQRLLRSRRTDAEGSKKRPVRGEQQRGGRKDLNFREFRQPAPPVRAAPDAVAARRDDSKAQSEERRSGEGKASSTPCPSS